MSQGPSPNNTPIQVQGGNLDYGMAPTSQAQQFITEETEAGSARGGGNPLKGWTLPAWAAGDFWSVYSMAEQFAANTGWKYLPTPQMIVSLIKGGNFKPQDVFNWMATVMKVPKTMPWAGLGMSATQYNQASANLGDSIYSLTGKGTAAEAGLAGIEQTALFNGWTSAHLQNFIQQNPALNKQYGYLSLGYNYQTFQTYKQSNAQALKARYGNSFTDQQAISNIAAPEASFHASGGAFGQYAPYTQSQTKIASGFSSAVR